LHPLFAKIFEEEIASGSLPLSLCIKQEARCKEEPQERMILTIELPLISSVIFLGNEGAVISKEAAKNWTAGMIWQEISVRMTREERKLPIQFLLPLPPLF
jgi:hypothetical protein